MSWIIFRLRHCHKLIYQHIPCYEAFTFPNNASTCNFLGGDVLSLPRGGSSSGCRSTLDPAANLSIVGGI